MAPLSRLLVRPEDRRVRDTAAATLLSPEAAAARSGEAWRYVGFEAYLLGPGRVLGSELGDREACIVVLGGRCRIFADGISAEIGARATPFEGRPAAAYLPPRGAFRVEALTELDVVVGYAPATAGGPPRALPPSGARLEIRGAGPMERRIHHILMEDRPASSLLVTEVVTPAGHWSSYPPHKHDTDDPPRERALEEIYYVRFSDPRGFALMRIYAKDGSLDETISVRDGDLVLVPRGYHTFSAAPGYEAYYLNVMAGPHREWLITFDPDHERMRW